MPSQYDVICWCGRSSRPGIFTDRHSAHFKMLNPLIALLSANTVLHVCLVKQLKYLCKMFTEFAAKFHTDTHTHIHIHTHTNTDAHTYTHMLFFKLFVTLSLIRWTSCACAQFSGCTSTTNAHSETGQMAVCFQNLTLGALSSCSALSMLVGALFKKFSIFLYMPHILTSLLDFLSKYDYSHIHMDL
jgi:hypothetical protein